MSIQDLMVEMDLFEDLVADAEAAAIPDDDKLASISNLANQQQTLEAAVKRHTEQLTDAQEALDRVSKVLLPAAMEAAGMKEFTLVDGSKIKVEPKYYAAISAANEPEAFAWLREHNHDGIIKTQITLAYGKGEAEQAAKARETLEASCIPFTNKESVHASTLKAFVKDQLTKGEDFPEKIFGVFTEKISTITKSKGTK